MNDTIEQQRDAQIERYLKNRMGADEQAQFEIRMLEEPELLERVQLLEALQAGMTAEERLLVADTGSGATQGPAILPFRSWLRQPLSLAASLLVAVLAAYTVVDRSPAPDTFSATPIGSLVLLDESRGGNTTRIEGTAPYLLQIDAGLDAQAASFDLSVNSDAGEILVEAAGLGADSNGWVRLLLDDLPAGEYRVVLNWRDTQGAAQSREYSIEFAE